MKMFKIIALLFMIAWVAPGCNSTDNSKVKLQGTYVGENGKYQKLVFGTDQAGQEDRVTLFNADGTEMSTTYEADKNEVIVKAPNTNVTFHIEDENTLKGENGDIGIYKKQ